MMLTHEIGVTWRRNVIMRKYLKFNDFSSRKIIGPSHFWSFLPFQAEVEKD